MHFRHRLVTGVAGIRAGQVLLLVVPLVSVRILIAVIVMAIHNIRPLGFPAIRQHVGIVICFTDRKR